MNRDTLKKEIVSDIDKLNDIDLQSVFRYIKFIKNKDEIDPTIEIVENAEYIKEIKQGLEDKNKNRVYKWNDVK